MCSYILVRIQCSNFLIFRYSEGTVWDSFGKKKGNRAVTKRVCAKDRAEKSDIGSKRGKEQSGSQRGKRAGQWREMAEGG